MTQDYHKTTTSLICAHVDRHELIMPKKNRLYKMILPLSLGGLLLACSQQQVHAENDQLASWPSIDITIDPLPEPEKPASKEEESAPPVVAEPTDKPEDSASSEVGSETPSEEDKLAEEPTAPPTEEEKPAEEPTAPPTMRQRVEQMIQENPEVDHDAMLANTAYYEQHASEVKDNIIDHNGGVDVKAEQAKQNADGSWTYTYQITTAAAVSTKVGTILNSFAVVMPSFAEQVEFRLIGTRDRETNEAKDVDVILGQHDSYREETNRPLPSYQRVQELAAGETYDHTIIRAVVDPEVIESMKAEAAAEDAYYAEHPEEDWSTRLRDRLTSWQDTFGAELSSLTGAKGDYRRLKAYGFVNNFATPVAMRLSFTITNEQHKKTPYVPL